MDSTRRDCAQSYGSKKEESSSKEEGSKEEHKEASVVLVCSPKKSRSVGIFSFLC
jgi:hypothetical protein